MDPGTQAVPVATGKGHDADKSVDQHDQLLPVSGTDASDFTTQAFFAGRDRKARNRAEGRARTSISAESDGRFDVLTAVTQGQLNEHWRRRWRRRPVLRDEIFVEQGDDLLDVPSIIPQLALRLPDGAGPAQGYCHLQFDDGVFKHRGPSPEQKLVAIGTADLDWVFPVNISLEPVPTQSAEHEALARHSFNVEPAQHSFTRLEVHLEDPSILDPRLDLCDFQDTDLATDHYARTKLATLLRTWILKTFKESKRECNLIGYSMLGRGLDHLPLPTQPPTSEMVQVYPYRPFVGVLNTRFFTFPKEGLGNRQADTNMLILLNMTRNRDFPASQYLPFSGNWCLPPPWEDGDGEEAPDGHAPVEPGVEDDYEIPACMCLGRELLLDDFLVRSSSGSDLSKSPLALITKFMHVRVTNVACGVQTVKADPDPDPWPDIIHHSVPEPSGDFTVQVFGKYIPRFHFDREHVATSGSRPGDDFYRFRPLDTANGVAWYWTNSHDIHGKERSHEETSLDHFFGVKAKARVDTRVEVRVPAGSNRIVISAKTSVKQTWQMRNGWFASWQSETAASSFSFNTTLRLISVESGNLEIDFPLTDANFADDYTTAGRVPVRPTPDDLPQFRRETQALGINLGHRLRAALEATREGLRANRRFVLPGAQHFKIADPMFNREGDLLVRLTPEGGDAPPSQDDDPAEPDEGEGAEQGEEDAATPGPGPINGGPHIHPAPPNLPGFGFEPSPLRSVNGRHDTA